MPINPPMTLPVDPHLLAQWRFDERKRWEDGRDPAQQAVSMVLGRWPDRLEFRSRSEVPGVAESARGIASTAAAAYRAQLLEVVGRITALPGMAEGVPAPAPAPPAPEDAADADDWLSRLDARLSSPPAPAAQDATRVAPPAAEPADAGLPDFLASAPWDDPAPAAPQEAFHVPPAAEPPAPEAFRARDPVPAVPVLDFVVEPEDPPAANGAAHHDAAPEAEPLPVFPFDREPAAYASSVTEDDALAAKHAAEPAVSPASTVDDAAPQPSVVPADEPEAVEFQGALPAPEPVEHAASVEDFAPAASASPSTSTATPAEQAASSVAASATASAAGAGAVRERLATLGREMGMGVSGHGAGPQGDASVAEGLAALDVVWTDGGRPVAAFLVAPASAAEGLLALSDVLAVQPGAAVPFYLVAPQAARESLRSQAGRPTFARMDPPLAQACRFIGFEALDQALSRVSGFLRYLRPEFVESLAEPL